MVTKPTKEFTDSSGRRKIKGNMDIELAVDAMELADHLDHVVLFSGDGDFRSLVEALQQKGKRVSVVSTLETAPPMVADELRRQADQFIDLDDLQNLISRDPSVRQQKEASQFRDRDRSGGVARQQLPLVNGGRASRPRPSAWASNRCTPYPSGCDRRSSVP